MKPFIKTAANFDATECAGKLKKAFKGVGCKKNLVTSVLATCDHSQRLQIEETYNKVYSPILQKRLVSETSGDFEKFCVALLLKDAELDAFWVNSAIKGLGTDEEGLIEILVSRSNAEIKAAVETYTERYQKSMVADIKSDTSGNFQELLLHLCEGVRDESDNMDQQAAKADAFRLYKKSKKLNHSGHKVFTPVLCQASKSQLSLIGNEFPNESKGINLVEHIKSAFKGDYANLLVALCEHAKDSDKFFITRLNEAISKKNETAVSRILTTRCDIDLGTIIDKYEQYHGVSLVEDIQKHFSGDFEKAFLTFLNAE